MRGKKGRFFFDGRLCKVYKNEILFDVTKRMTKWESCRVASCCLGCHDFTGPKASWLIWNPWSLNLLEPSGPVQGLLCLMFTLSFVKSEPEKQKGVKPILFFRKHIIFLTPKCDLQLFNYWSSSNGTVFGLTNHLHKKKLGILTNATYVVRSSSKVS